MKKVLLSKPGFLCIVVFLLCLKAGAQCDLHNSIDVSGHRLSSRLTLLSYQWVTCPDYTPLPGATAQTWDVWKDGDYALIGILDTCTDTTDCVSITGLGIGNTMVPDEISIFPNPVKDGRINISGNRMYPEASVQILDVLGKVKWASTVHFEQGAAQLNLQLPAGIYFMIVDGKEAYRKRTKMIIE